MKCEQTHELIHAYIDGELDLLRNAEIEHHLGECAACRSKHEAESNLRSLIRGEAQYFAAPDTLKQRVKKQTGARKLSRRWIAAGT